MLKIVYYWWLFMILAERFDLKDATKFENAADKRFTQIFADSASGSKHLVCFSLKGFRMWNMFGNNVGSGTGNVVHNVSSVLTTTTTTTSAAKVVTEPKNEEALVSQVLGTDEDKSIDNLDSIFALSNANMELDEIDRQFDKLDAEFEKLDKTFEKFDRTAQRVNSVQVNNFINRLRLRKRRFVQINSGQIGKTINVSPNGFKMFKMKNSDSLNEILKQSSQLNKYIKNGKPFKLTKFKEMGVKLNLRKLYCMFI